MVTILIGIPGSGKTTWIKNNAKGPYVVASADHFFEGPDGYKYDISKQGEAHAQCLRTFIQALQDGKEVYVDNTNLTVLDLAPYVAVTVALTGSLPRVVVLTTPPEVAFQRQIHGVPQDVHNNMLNRFQQLSREWPARWPDPEIIEYKS